MKVLVLGGTGAMGIHLVSNLVKMQCYVHVTTRSDKDSESQFIKYIKGNAQDNQFLNSLLQEKYDVIVDFMVYNTKKFKERVDLLLSATSQYIFLSSSRVYSNSDEIIVEDTPRLLDYTRDKEYLKTDEYALAKARQEDILFNHNNKNWTIVRPYITYDA
ncbi:MAG: NAD-dependent epimerase/dehydratase family protein [Bacillota bacterium]